MTTYYVAPAASGGSDSNNGSIGSPFLTGAKCESIAQPGDTFNFRTGSYGGWTFNGLQGSNGSPITFKAYPGETVYLDPAVGVAQEFIRSWASFDQLSSEFFTMSGICSYIVFDGFKFKNTTPAWDLLLTLDISNDPDWNTYKSHLMDNRLCCGVWSFHPPAQEPPYSHHLTFQNMTFEHGDGIMGGEFTDSIFMNNHIINSRYTYMWYSRLKNCLFYNNIFEDSPRGFQFNGCSGPYGTLDYISTSNVTFNRNIFRNFGNHAWPFPQVVDARPFGGDAIYLCPSGSVDGLPGCNFYNNLFYDICINIPQLDSGGFGIRLIWGGDHKIYNNLFYNIGPAFGSAAGGILSEGGNDIHNNIAEKFAINVGDVQSNNIMNQNVDAHFVDVVNRNFHLVANSSARNQGVTLIEVTEDYDSISRPQESAYDIGPYEFFTPMAGQINLQLQDNMNQRIVANRNF